MMAKTLSPAGFLDTMEAIGFILSGDRFIFPRGVQKLKELPGANFVTVSGLLAEFREMAPPVRKALSDEAQERITARAEGFEPGLFITAVEATRHNLTVLLTGDDLVGPMLWGRSECERFAPVPSKEDRQASDQLADLWRDIFTDGQRIAIIHEVHRRVACMPTAEVVGSVGDGWQPATPAPAQAA